MSMSISPEELLSLVMKKVNNFYRFLQNGYKNQISLLGINGSKNTIAIWDNRSTQHFVVNNFQGERVIQRVTVTGDIVEPFGELNHDAWSNNNKFSAKSRNDLQLIGYLDSQKENH